MDVNFTYNFTIDDGNYDICEFMNAVNTLASNYINITYNQKRTNIDIHLLNL
jgi:hypothetical protein